MAKTNGKKRPKAKAASDAEPAIRNRIKGHRRVRAGDLLPNELNFRRHPDHQRAALQGVYDEVGFARSLLAYETEDGKLKLLDGHLRQEMTPDMLVDVEVLDVTEDEARKLLAVIDPLAAMATADAAKLDELLKSVSTSNEAVQAMLAELSKANPLPVDVVPPDEFAQVDEGIETEHACPKCGYRWSGGQ